eukprot:TRINITY_DN3944_c0_g1_i5.p1 TRINITY_DN3944_c0_g1~~TRINITY_DN3944_c0_g1_i5.p1  ORF type:complete len:408 (-),score=48.58 TRINITY_DN3944_c0_g1_i5:528-1751(-)
MHKCLLLSSPFMHWERLRRKERKIEEESESKNSEKEGIRQSLPPSTGLARKRVCLTMDIKETSSWSNLPQCLLELILERLILPDRLRFGSVCRSWYTAQAQSLHLPVSRLPFLVFRRGSSSIELFSLTEKKIYKMPMPKCETPMSHLHCVSSSHGWLMFISTKKNETGFLFNPFIKKCVRLPNKKIGFLGLDCIFFSTPTDPDGIFHIMQGCQTLMLCSLKDPSRWSIFDESEQGNVVSNTILCDGKLYALNDDWTLANIDPLFPHNVTNVKMEDLRHFPRIPRLRVPNQPDHEYILVESSGEILIAKIIRHSLRKLTCEIFRADLPKMKWVRVENLGDRMLLLTKTTSISICASEIGCKGNRIYYILTLFNSYVEFDLGSKEMTTHSIPVDDDDARICEWLTTGLP